MGEAALSHHTLSKLCRHRTHSQIWPPHFCTAACTAPCAAPLPNRTLDSILRCCSLQHSTCAKLRTLYAPPAHSGQNPGQHAAKLRTAPCTASGQTSPLHRGKTVPCPAPLHRYQTLHTTLVRPRARNLSNLLTLATAPCTAQHRPSTAPLTAPCTARGWKGRHRRPDLWEAKTSVYSLPAVWEI